MQAASENFPVASRLLPPDVRADLMAIYGYARLTDDIGDELDGDRTEALDWLEAELERAASGTATHPVLVRVGDAMRRRGLSPEPMRALIEANRVDQRVHRYATFHDLVGYCRLSANPVGHLVLEVLGAATPERLALSDDVCTGLQVVEHIQDVAEDYGRGRIYLPDEDLRDEGCAGETLGAPTASLPLRRVIERECSRARTLLFSGAPLSASLPLRPRLAVAAFAGGGMAALDAVAAAHYDVLAHPCRPTPRRLLARTLLVIAWGSQGATVPAQSAGPGAGPGTGHGAVGRAA